MKRPLRLRIALLAGACTVAANAHHSFAAVYDSRKPTTLSGVVTGVEWLNPHARFFGDAENDAGVVENRGCELGAFTAPWTVRQSMHYLPDTELIEHICEENDKLPERIGIE